MPLLTAGGGQGFCVNLSVDTSSVDIMTLCREIGALYIDTVVEPWLGFYFDKSIGPETALQLRAARDAARGQAQEPGRHHRGLLLRRQSRHGVLVRQAGAARHRRATPTRRLQRAEEPRRLGPARAQARRQGHPHRRARHPALQEAEADERVRQHLVGGRLRVGRHAAGRTRLGHARKVDAGQRPQAHRRLRRGDLSAAARRQHARALLVPDAGRAIRLPRHPQRVDLDRRLFHACATATRWSTGRPATTPITRPTTRCCRCTRCSARPARCSRHGTSSTRTRSSTASTSSACCSTATARTPTGTARSSRSRRPAQLAPYQNATGMQVTSAVLAGMVWALENPERRHRRGRRDGFPPLPRNPDAVSRPGEGLLHRLDAAHRPAGTVPGGHRHSDPWQFRNVLVR